MRMSYRFFILFFNLLLLFCISHSAYIFIIPSDNIKLEDAQDTGKLLLLDEGKAVILSDTTSPPLPISGNYDIYGPISDKTELFYVYNPLNIDLSDIIIMSRYKIDIGSEKFIITGNGAIDEEVRYRGADSYKLLPYIKSTNSQFTPPEIKYNPLIDSIIERVSPPENYKIDDNLSSIPTRYSYSNDVDIATYFINDKLSAWGYDTRIFDYQYNIQDQCWIEDIHRLTDRSEFWFPMRSGYIFHSNDGGLSFDRSQCKILGTAIYFLNNKKGWVAGYSKQIAKTDDGILWRTIDTGFNYRFSDIYFINENTGFMTTRDGFIVRTDDGGDTWRVIYNTTNYSLLSITFADETHGFACGENSTLLITTDGGSTWNLKDLPVSNVALRKVFFLNQNEGWIVGSGGVMLHTGDGGENWELKRQGSEYLLSIDFINSNEGWCCGISGVIMHTTDGGNTWTNQNSGTQDSYLFGIIAFGNNIVFCVGTGQILRTTDGGDNWQKVNLGEFAKLNWKDVVASRMGTEYPDEEIILVAHYDSISDLPWDRAPGANDNGSGTTAVLSIAKALQDIQTKRTIRYLLVTGEEEGLNGSRAYAQWARKNNMNIVAVLNMDMISYLDDNNIDVDITSNDLYKWLGDYIFNIGDLYLPDIRKYTYQGRGGSDHIPFWENNYPAVMSIEHAGSHWYPYYHTTSDLMTYLDFDFQSLVTKLNMATTLTLAEPIGIGSAGIEPEIIVFPNPFNIGSAITSGVVFSGVSDYRTISIYSISGDKIDEITIDGKDSVLWDVSSTIKSGIYLWVINGDSGTKTGKLAIIK